MLKIVQNPNSRVSGFQTNLVFGQILFLDTQCAAASYHTQQQHSLKVSLRTSHFAYASGPQPLHCFVTKLNVHYDLTVFVK